MCFEISSLENLALDYLKDKENSTKQSVKKNSLSFFFIKIKEKRTLYYIHFPELLSFPFAHIASRA